jgi:long-chain acyl-CoA synthetase
MVEGGKPLSLAQATRTLIAAGAPHEIVEQDVRGLRLRCWKHVPATLRELILHARCFGQRPFLVYEDERCSYAEGFAAIARIAHGLQELGVHKGDRVAIAMRNYPEWPLAFLATTAIGAIAVPLNAWWKGQELAYGLTDSGCKVLFADDERMAALRDHWIELQALEHLVVVRAALPGDVARLRALTFEQLLACEGEPTELPPVELLPDDDATIFYTSGTTGNPKGALGTHRNLVTNVGSVGFVRARGALRRGEPLPDAFAAERSTLVSVPLFHVTGCHSMLAVGLFSGQKLVLMYKWSPERALELIERERITQFGGVPAMAWQVLESPDFARRDTSSVLGIGYGGAPAAPELQRRIAAACPGVSASNGYGLTETSALAASNVGIDYERKPDSVGPALPICDVRVVAEDGRDLAVGEIGELWIRGPNIVKGYWNKHEATAHSARVS